jgi:YVTN family beta-propeller protein
MRNIAATLFVAALSLAHSLPAQERGPVRESPPAQSHKTLLYVGNSRGDDISVIDLGTLKVVDRIKLGDQIHGLAAEASGQRLFATVETDHTLRIVDTADDHPLATIPLSGRPNQCAVTPDGSYVVVPIRDADRVDIVDTQQRRVVKSLPLKAPHNAVTDPASNRFVFVSSMGDRQISLIDLSKLAYSARFLVGGVPRPYVVGDQGHLIYVAESDLHGFVVVNVPENRVMERIEIPAIHKTAHPRPFEPIDTLTHGLALRPDGEELWVTSLLDDSIYVYDVRLKKVSQRLPTGDGPNWISFSPDGKFACVSNTDSHDVSIFDAEQHKEVARIKTGGAPKRVLVVDVPEEPHL